MVHPTAEYAVHKTLFIHPHIVTNDNGLYMTVDTINDVQVLIFPSQPSPEQGKKIDHIISFEQKYNVTVTIEKVNKLTLLIAKLSDEYAMVMESLILVMIAKTEEQN